MIFLATGGWSIATGNIPSLKGRGAFWGAHPFWHLYNFGLPDVKPLLHNKRINLSKISYQVHHFVAIQVDHPVFFVELEKNITKVMVNMNNRHFRH